MDEKLLENVLRLLTFLFILTPVSGVASAATLIRTPYLQNTTHHSVTIRWMTDVPAESHVSFGPAVGSLSTTVSHTTTVVDHEVVLPNLLPDQRYYYRVSDSSGVLAGGDVDHYFDTHPLPGSSAPVRIWVLGDSGGCGDTPALCPVVQANKSAYLAFADAQRADMLLFLGDNAYWEGSEEEYTRAVFDMFPDVLRNTPSWSAIGNHDFAGGAAPYLEAFTHPTAGEGGGYPSGREYHYSFDRGDVHFISLMYTFELVAGSIQYDWLVQDLIQNDAGYTIAFIHVSPYSKGSHDSDTENLSIELRSTLIPLLEDYGVDLVLTGHSHGYERSVLIDGHYADSSTCAAGECFIDGGDGNPAGGSGGYAKPSSGPAPHQGTVYAVVGNGSQTWTDAQMGDHPVMVERVGEVGSLVIDIEGSQLDAYMVDRFGAVRDQFRITKGATPVPTGGNAYWKLLMLSVFVATGGFGLGIANRRSGIFSRDE